MALAKLPEILGDYTLDDYRKIVTEKRKKINKEIETIPIRVSEVSNGLPDIEGLDATQVNEDLSFLRDSQEKKRDELTRVKAGGEVAEKTKQLREVEGELIGIKNTYHTEANSKEHGLRSELSLIQRQALDTRSTIKSKRNIVEGNNASIASKEVLSAGRSTLNMCKRKCARHAAKPYRERRWQWPGIRRSPLLISGRPSS